MNLVLMRHGLAEPRERHHDSDSDRNLTNEGRLKLMQFIPLIHPWFPKPDRLLTSPAIRTQQTAEILCDILHVNRDEIQVDPLILNGSAGEIVSQLVEMDLPSCLWIVGHQPTLGQLLSVLIGLDVFRGFHMSPGDCALVSFQDKPDINEGRLLSYASPRLIDRSM
ncbi:MAG: hypothetical protein DRP86_04000 [Candidatus Neomarinimicrobiota bacterium]|nr:histidine phosphatase family protein [Candidatus Neomarinimicrobiota bacterium]RKY50186.1 MAG: hypothetical protein DRP86_04000 [Candidatus Neomarinimicrobiota bacterium]